MNSISFNNFKIHLIKNIIYIYIYIYVLFKKFLILIDVRYYNCSYKILGPIRHGLQVTRSHISPSHLNIIL